MALNHRKKTSKQEVLRILRDRILYLELKPGASISDMELAEELEVSRTPIREALLLLSQEHLVNIYPQSGTFVAPIDLGRSSISATCWSVRCSPTWRSSTNPPAGSCCTP